MSREVRYLSGEADAARQPCDIVIKLLERSELARNLIGVCNAGVQASVAEIKVNQG